MTAGTRAAKGGTGGRWGYPLWGRHPVGAGLRTSPPSRNAGHPRDAGAPGAPDD
ncbi:hypothetical protein GCM10010377_00110 [Streptomyces viridiviolaceus]|nr:hypothetical protein GCM10010377_00110 [Streptomyces viridiviolaceus]